MKNITTLLLILLWHSAKASSVDTINVYSKAMHRNIRCVVIKPNKYKTTQQRFPVVYLLHGWSGNYSDWIKKVPEIKEYADNYQLMIVCPDGGYNSWYYDSPIDSSMRYETYISSEVPHYIDSVYRTIAKKEARAITGLSMGGHGAIFLALRHQDIFGAAGSMSGGLDINATKTQFGISYRIGDTLNYAQNWKDYSVLYLIEKYSNPTLSIIFDCGLDDFYYEANKAFHEKLVSMKIVHDYIVRSGSHTWEYWQNSVAYHLLFFRKFFNKKS
jgi:S-formylglutathione hydrolase FrmB